MSKAVKKKNKNINEEGVAFLDWKPPQTNQHENEDKKKSVVISEERAEIIKKMIGKYEEKAGKEVEDNVLLHPSRSRGKNESGGGGPQLHKSHLNSLPFSKDVLVALYFFVNIGFLAFSSFDYYSLVSPYIDYGGDEALVTFAAFGTVLYYLCLRFFYLYIDRCRNMMHVIIIFLIPSTFFELSYETYLDQAQLVSGFDRWFVFYKEGESALQKGEDKAAYLFFRRSVEDLNVEPREAKFMLRFKSLAQAALIEGKYSDSLKDEDKEKILKNNLALWKLYPEGEFPNSEYLMLTLDITRLWRELGGKKEHYNWIQKIKSILKITEIVPDDFKYGFMYESILLEWQPDKDSILLTPEVASEIISESSLKKWETYFNYALKNFLEVGTKDNKMQKWQKKIMAKVFLPLSILYQNGHHALVLENYLRILGLLRNSQLTEELGHVYSVIADIYEKQGQAEKALIYRENANRFELK